MNARSPAALRLFAAAAPMMLLAGLASATPAQAQAQDGRLVTVKYDPNKVVTIRGRERVQATIRFADDERIENVAIGDSNAWQVTPNKRANLLFIKPLEAGAATNMTVVTNLRTYFFDLVTGGGAKPVYVLNFDYPKPVAAPGAAVQMAAGGDAPAAVSVAAPEVAVDPASLNFDWKRKGDKKLLPERSYDDGEATFLVWPEGRDVPAILMLAEDGETEGPVNFTVRGDTVIIDGVPSTIVLRAGRNHATLTYGGKPLAQRQAAARQRAAAALASNAPVIQPELAELN